MNKRHLGEGIYVERLPNGTVRLTDECNYPTAPPVRAVFLSPQNLIALAGFILTGEME